MAVIVTNANWLQVDGARLQKGKWDLSLTKAGVRLSDAGERIDIPYEGTTIDGDIVGSSGELFAFFEAQGFKQGGSGPGPEPGDAVWGGITGTLSNQTDLNEALGLKANSADLGTASTADSSDFATAEQGVKADSAVQPAITIVGVGSSTLTYDLTHAGLDKIVRTTGGGDKTHTVPPFVDVAWPTGSVIQLATPSSDVTITAGSGVNIIADKAAPWVVAANTMATLVFLGSNEWILAAKFKEA